MTKLKILFLTIISTIILTGCSLGADPEETQIQGEITSISTDRIMVNGTRGSNDFDGYVKLDTATEVYNADGEKVRAITLQVGDEVTINSSGATLKLSEEDTPVVSASKININ